MKKIAVIGSGTWGTALSLLLNANGNKVCMWSWKDEEMEQLRKTRENKNLPKIKIPDEIELTSDLEESMKDAEVILLAVPSVAIRETIEQAKQFIKNDQIIVIAAKGIEESTTKTMTEIIKEVSPHIEVAVLSGPSHAEEVAVGIPTTCVIATKKKDVAKELQDIFMNEYFRVYINPDIVGVELGGALKNIIALAAGIIDGLELGDNTKAALMTRGLLEITRIGAAMGADQRTFYGLTGFGDLIVTCNSIHSRNRKMGILLGKGYSMEESMKEIEMVVEGVYSARAAYKLAQKFNIEVPIIEAVNKVLFDDVKAKKMVSELMHRTRKAEIAENIENINQVDWE